MNILLYVTESIHLCIDLICMFYIFLFNPIYDIYFCGFILLQTFHWILLKNECSLSYIEKKLINPNYKLGEDPKWIPHYDTFYNSYTKISKALLILGGLSYVIYRNKQKYIKLICILAIVLWIYLTFFYNK